MKSSAELLSVGQGTVHDCRLGPYNRMHDPPASRRSLVRLSSSCGRRNDSRMHKSPSISTSKGQRSLPSNSWATIAPFDQRQLEL